MCRPSDSHKKVIFELAMHNEKHRSSQTVSQPTIVAGIVLSTVVYLVQRGVKQYPVRLTSLSSSRTLVPYLLVLACILNARRKSLLARIQWLKRQLVGWKNRVEHSTLSSSGLTSLSSSEALSRLSRVSSTETIRRLSKSIRSSLKSYRQRSALKAITRKECFARLSSIEQLSIGDLTVLFQYVTDVNQVDFDKKRFMSEQSKLVRAVVTAMDMAVSISRGGLSVASQVNGNRKEGDVDALYFVAVARVFAEWRTLRLVPKGFQRYAMALNLAYRDFFQNLAKIEDGVHSYLKHHQANHQIQKSSEQPEPVQSPTLRQLLEYEHQSGVHPNLPRLKEASAASGLLWSKRQMHYQVVTWANFLLVPIEFRTPKDAALGAYKQVYDSYHGWATRQVFQHSMGGSPPLEKIWLVMIPPRRDHHNDSPGELERQLSDVSEDGESQDNEVFLALEGFGKGVAAKWEELFDFFNCVSDSEKKKSPNNVMADSEGYDGSFNIFNQKSNEEQERTDESNPVVNVKIDTAAFVNEMCPLLEDMAGLIEAFNMNDPTKV